MKTKFQVPNDKCRIDQQRSCDCVIRHSSSVILAFTLIELLTVISIIAILAAFTVPVLKGIKRQQYLRSAQAGMEQIETAIERYHAAYGFYPPDNPTNALVNQLYFELLGTTVITNASLGVNGNPLVYQSLDDPTMQLPQGGLNSVFSSSVNGFMNCNRPGASEDTRPAQNFLPGLKPDQVAVYTNYFPQNKLPIKLLVASVGGPDLAYCPLGTGAPGINPWRYNSSNPTNNPGAYDLWVQLSISGKTNLICNWSKQVQFNSPLP
jgi:prepilin-type N-terminal cleavage/methylation domain-containing protein